MAARHSTRVRPWRAVVFTWPVDHYGIATSRKIIAGTFKTSSAALKAAEAKLREIGGVAFTAELHVTT